MKKVRHNIYLLLGSGMPVREMLHIRNQVDRFLEDNLDPEDVITSLGEIAAVFGQDIQIFAKVGQEVLQGDELRIAETGSESAEEFWDDILGPSEVEDYHHTWNVEDFDGVGDPEAYGPYWDLQNGNSCAVNAQRWVIESMTDIEMSEEEACQLAIDNDWYDPASGTMPEHMNKILEYHGLETNMSYGDSENQLEKLIEALENGDHVIVGLNAHEIWSPQRYVNSGMPVEQYPPGGHAVWVTGVDFHEDGSITVIMNDTGHPNGRMEAVALEDFVNAWGDFDNLMVIAHQ